jgi:hypothetical protein
MYYTIDYGSGVIHGFNSGAEACAHTTGGSITVYWNGTLGNGTCLYLDSGGVTQLDGFDWYSIGGYSFGVDVCSIISYAVCVTPTPTPTRTPTPTPTSTTPAKTEVYFNICGSQSAAGGGAGIAETPSSSILAEYPFSHRYSLSCQHSTQ